ncbi:uncharacterized protein [Lepeophtheirus salmonis]|uniref:uncharacterized protein n=1 Tax=Lepeophtheirus salmonis TaxID=72036 RepID=UPI001AE3AF1D|nr:uncharacterized protein LOC121132388 [Lepeophtheirus salmonis]
MEIPIHHLVKGLVSFMDSNKDYNINQANDFTIECIKDEMSTLEKEGVLGSLKICSSLHGGPLDYPKTVNTSMGLVSSKWDICFERIERSRKKILNKNHEDSDEEVFAEISVNAEEVQSQEIVDFISTVNESAAKLFSHCVSIVNLLLAKGDSNALLVVLGGISLVRNKMWAYGQVLFKAFDDTYAQYCKLLDSVSEQVLEYFTTTISTTVLHDSSSQDWNNPKEFYEGEKISHCVRMWGFVLRGYKSDLWSTLPPKTAQKIYASIFDDSLGILTSRYSAVTPTEKRIQQYRADISFILNTIFDTMNHIVTVSLDKILFFGNCKPHPQNQIIRNIRNKAWTLHQCLTTIGVPHEHLKKFKNSSIRQMNNISRADSSCLRFIKKGMEEDHISLLVRTISSHPEPIWPLVIQALFCRNKVLPFTILEGIGNYVPKDDEIKESNECGGFQCSMNCVLENQRWPLSAGFGIMKIISKMPDNDSLSKGLFRVLKKSKTSWTDCFCSSSIWNTNKKPVWFTGLVHLLEPYLIPVISELIDMLKSGEAWAVSHVPKVMEKSIDLLKDCIVFIPSSILKALQSVEDISNGEGEPLCGSVHLHFLFTSLYGIVLRLQYLLKQGKLQREKLDFIIAYGEALCSLRPSSQLESLKKLMKEIHFSDEYDEKLTFSYASLDRFDNEYSYILAENIANDLLSDKSGRYACVATYKFILNNCEWISQVLKNKENVEIEHNIDFIRIFKDIDDEEFLNRDYQWDEMIHYTMNYASPKMICRLLQHRHELIHPEDKTKDLVVRDIINQFRTL